MSLDTKQLLTEAVDKVEGIADEAKVQMVESLNDLTVVLAENIFNERKEALDEEHQSALKELEESVESQLEEKFDGALTEAAIEFMKENQDKFDAALKVELAESFLTGLTALVKEHGVLISPEITSVQESASNRESQYVAEIERLEALEESLNEQLFDLQKTVAIAEATQKLTVLQKDKVVSLSEALQSKDIESFKKSLTNIVEALGKKEPEDKEGEKDEESGEEDKKEKKVDESLTPGQRYAAMFKK